MNNDKYLGILSKLYTYRILTYNFNFIILDTMDTI